MARTKQSPDTSADDTKSDVEVKKPEGTDSANPSNAAPSSPPASQASDANAEADGDEELRQPTAKDFKSVAKKMEEAPRDGRRILILSDTDEPVVVRYDERLNAYVDRHDFTVIPQCWVPLW